MSHTCTGSATDGTFKDRLNVAANAAAVAAGGETVLTGDVTGSGAGGVPTTIANNAVTYAKLQDVSQTQRVLGRNSSGAGDPEEVSLSQLLDWIGSAAQGDVLYRGAFGWARLPAGTSGQVLSSGGSGANPLWANRTQTIQVAASDESTAITAGSAKLTFRMPYAFAVTSVRASLTVAQTSGAIFTVNVKKNGTTLFSTKITIDNTERTSTTAATPSALTSNPTSFSDDDEVVVDVDQIGDGTAKGLKLALIGYPT